MKKTSKELVQLQNQLSELSIQIADSFGIKLDFSIDSIYRVNDILEKFHQDYTKTKNEEGVRGIALEFAAYMIMVIERNGISGFWERNSEDMGQDTFPYQLEDGRIIYPYSWCLKRIIDGPSDDVWVKFNTLVLDKG